MNPIEIKHLWHSTIEKLPAPDEEALGYASSLDLENFGYHVVTYDPILDSWHEVNGRRSIPNITHGLPLDPPMKIMVKLHHKEVAAREKATRGKRHRRESDRNKDIIIRLLNGQTSQEVGDFYGISHSRVGIIASRIFRKVAL